MARLRRAVQTPGEPMSDEIEDQPSTSPSDDAAIAAGQSGGTHRIAKHSPVAPAPAQKVPDPTRGATSAINAKRETTLVEAKALDAKGKLQRAMLTEAGWYVPRNSMNERRARRKNGEDEMVEIE